MSAISITVTQDTANQALFELMQSVTPARFAGKVGPALVNETKQHLGRLGKNKQGYKSTRFYENFSVFWSPDNPFRAPTGAAPLKLLIGEDGDGRHHPSAPPRARPR